jgi:hypothetical protein
MGCVSSSSSKKERLQRYLRFSIIISMSLSKGDSSGDHDTLKGEVGGQLGCFLCCMFFILFSVCVGWLYQSVGTNTSQHIVIFAAHTKTF